MFEFRMTEEQELLLESLRELIERELPESYVRECEEEHKPMTEFMEKWREAGFHLLGVPEEYGGTPVDILTLMLFQMEVNRLTSAGYALGTNAISIDDMKTFGSEEQFAETMRMVCEGRNPFALGLTEACAGSDSSAIQTTFERRNGKIYINGSKMFCTGAGETDHMLCMTIDPKCEDPRMKFSTWWVDMHSPGITMEPIKKTGWNMIKTYNVTLRDVVCEEKDIVGVEGCGFMNVMKNFEIERILLAANCAGQAQLAYEDALEYATQRQQFGQAIGKFQLIQEKLTDMAIKCENMRNLVIKAAWLKDQGEPVNLQSAMCKRYCAQASNEVIDDAIQIFGGLGVCEETRVARMFRNNRINRIGGGTDEVMVHIIGRGLQKQFLKNGGKK